MSLKNILNDERPLPSIRYMNYPPTPPMYYYGPQPGQQQPQVSQLPQQPQVAQIQPQMPQQVVIPQQQQVAQHIPQPQPQTPLMHQHQHPHTHSQSHMHGPPHPVALPSSPPLYQPPVPIVNVNLNNAHNKKRKKYLCDCGRSFTTSGHLARHMRIHTGEKNYECPYDGCTSRFSRQDNCMQHYRTHLGTSRNSMLRRKSGSVSPPPGVSKPQDSKPVERKMSNFLSTVLVT